MAELAAAWEAQWPAALALWSRYTRLSAPRWCLDADDARREGIAGSFACIRLHDQAVVIDLPQVRACGVHPFALQILGHEIGHHVYAPANLEDAGRALARIRRALPGIERQASLVANLYEDALINDRLHRACNLDMAAVYQALDATRKPKDRARPARTWTLYMRIFEILWSLRRGTIALGEVDAALEGDAHLGARLVRSYARDWVRGAGRFAALFFPYLMEDQEERLAGRTAPPPRRHGPRPRWWRPRRPCVQRPWRGG